MATGWYGKAMATDLILKGTFKIGATDCSADVTGVHILGTRNDVVIPATLAAGTTHDAGAAKYSLQIDYLSDDADSGILFPLFWTAIATDTKELSFTALLRNGLIGVGNPQWAGTFVVSAADVGGDVEALSTGSLTCVMTDQPAITTA